MVAAMHVNSTNTYYLADVPSYMEGEAKQIVRQILSNSLEVVHIDERGEDAANLFTRWYRTGVLRNYLICVKPRDLFREQVLADIEEAIEELAEDWENIGAMILQEETERLQDHYAFVEDPMRYMDLQERN
jgi:hypothetical protein